jgi:hypothetical protein
MSKGLRRNGRAVFNSQKPEKSGHPIERSTIGIRVLQEQFLIGTNDSVDWRGYRFRHRWSPESRCCYFDALSTDALRYTKFTREFHRTVGTLKSQLNIERTDFMLSTSTFAATEGSSSAVLIVSFGRDLILSRPF